MSKTKAFIGTMVKMSRHPRDLVSAETSTDFGWATSKTIFAAHLKNSYPGYKVASVLEVPVLQLRTVLSAINGWTRVFTSDELLACDPRHRVGALQAMKEACIRTQDFDLAAKFRAQAQQCAPADS